jgi:hypothetical protein
MLLAIVRKNMDQYVMPSLASTTIGLASCDLWMSHDGVDTLILVINFLNDTWVPMHVTMGLFEMNETIG